MKKKLCIVVPYRDREQHLLQFIPNITEELEKQGIDFSILIVEQTFEKSFNRAKLLNVGFDYTKGEFDYYCFHDIDMLPDESDYSYCDQPTHLAARAEQFGWKLPYEKYFGGVTIFNKESFVKVNGYGNNYWGWGAEDDDMFNRVIFKGLKPNRKDCKFRSLYHARNIDTIEYNKNLEILNGWALLVDKDGLSSLKYDIIETEIYDSYTKIKVEI